MKLQDYARSVPCGEKTECTLLIKDPPKRGEGLAKSRLVYWHVKIRVRNVYIVSKRERDVTMEDSLRRGGIARSLCAGGNTSLMSVALGSERGPSA